MLLRLLKTLLVGLATLWVVATLTFFLLRVMPGGPFDEARQVPPAIKANLEARFHLREPLVVQYGLYMGGLLRGDLGPSYKYVNRRVNDMVLPALSVSTVLGLLALLLGVGSGLAVSLWRVSTQNKTVKLACNTLGVLTLATPTFIVGALLVLLFCYGLNWLPAARWVTPWHAILPSLTLAILPFSTTYFVMSTALTETARQPFIRIKQAFGLTESLIIWKHMLKSALIPLLSILGPLGAAIVTGSFAVEWVFAIPGLGKYFINAISNRDYTLVMGITLIYAILLIVFNAVMELVMTAVDPRLARRSEAH